MRNLTLILNREEAQHLLNCLKYPSVTQEAIKVQLDVEDILAKYLKITIDDVELGEKWKEEEDKNKCKHCGRRDSATICKLFPSPCKNT
jgi:hypothetical protein